ncbi:MAG: hypothetical protein RL141_503 [Candidatus Parcubacteria bacterium]|jgi:hypothetical protein
MNERRDDAMSLQELLTLMNAVQRIRIYPALLFATRHQEKLIHWHPIQPMKLID